MSKKKAVTAPLSYDPGKGRPKEYLAYLNWQEMQALQRLNGGNIERGPKGLPSFPPDWSGSKNSAGNWKGASTSGGGSDSGSRGSSSSRSSESSTTASNAAARQQASDTAARQAAETKSAAPAARGSALSQDARKAGIGSINVGPMQTPVRIGDGKISKATKSSTPSVSAANNPYGNDPSYQSAVQQLRREEERLRAPEVRRDSAKIAREFDPYDATRSPRKETFLDKQFSSFLRGVPGPVSAAVGIANASSNFLSNLYNDPVDAAKTAAKAALAPAALGGMYLMGEKQAFNNRGVPTEGAVKDLTDAALAYGVGTSAASLAAPAPAGSVGAFVRARVSPAPEIQRAARYAEAVTDKYPPGSLTPEQIKDIERSIYDKTARMVSQDVSGIQYMRPSQTWASVDPWSNPSIEIAQTYTPKVSGVGAPKKYSDVFKEGPVNYFVPQVEDVNIISDKRLVSSVDPNLGYYNKSGVYDPYTGITGGIRQIYDMARGRSGALPGPGVSINTFDPSVLGRYDQSVDKLARHEIGTHYMSDISGGLYGPGTVAGPDYWKGQISKTAPTANPRTVRELSWSAYQDALEEQAARKMEERNYANKQWRNYGNRFSYFSPEEMADAEAARILGVYYERNR